MELLDRVANADDKALKALYDRTSSKLYGLALRIVREQDAAEDVLQEAFVSHLARCGQLPRLAGARPGLDGAHR